MYTEAGCTNRSQSFIWCPGVAIQDKEDRICEEAVSQPIISYLCSSWRGNKRKKGLRVGKDEKWGMETLLRMEQGRGAYEEKEVRNVGKQELGKAGNGHLECEEAGCRGNQESRGNPEADTWGCEEAGRRGAKKH